MKDNNINIYQIMINKAIDNTIQVYIFEINTNHDLKRYFYCILNLKNGKYNLYRIASIGTLMEYLDKHGIDIKEINRDNQKLLSLLMKYNRNQKKNNWVEYIYSSAKLYSKNEYNNKKIDKIVNNDEINNYIQLYKKLDNIKLNNSVDLFQKPTDIDMAYILDKKNKGIKKQ